MSAEKGRDVDARVGEYLASTFPNESRRSFLARLTRAVYAMMGVAIGSTVLPIRIPDAHAQGSPSTAWKNCGLRGAPCRGACDVGTVGSGPTRHWVACCPDPSCGEYHCCKYRDKCGTMPTPRPPGCGFGSGYVWCGGAAGTYICTQVSCESAPSGTDMTNCSCGSAGSPGPSGSPPCS